MPRSSYVNPNVVTVPAAASAYIHPSAQQAVSDVVHIGQAVRPKGTHTQYTVRQALWRQWAGEQHFPTG